MILSYNSLIKEHITAKVPNMTKPTLTSLQETIVSKFISLYKATFKIGDNIKEYDFASRNTTLSNTGLTTKTIGKTNANAVTIFVFNKDKTKMLLIKEFRFPINSYVIASPAGLIDDNEDFKTAALRELYEEIGYTEDQVKIFDTLLPSYSSVGLTDEQTASVFVTVDDAIQPKQNLEGTEDIQYFWINACDAKSFLDFGKLPTWHADPLNLTDENDIPIKIGITARTQLVLKQFVNKNLPSDHFLNIINSL